jgi:hypothetical protein
MYIIFGGDIYYPVGGAKDIIGFYEKFETALFKFNNIILANQHDWVHILDSENKEIIRDCN